ncbi:MAG TPA: hypothetical protein PK876_02940 [Elusimicrobiota bacterium]|nr:hypothetical protein [Elusimicrobiota bacterium]
MTSHRKILLAAEAAILVLLAGLFIIFETVEFKSPGIISQGYYDQCGAEHLVKVLNRHSLAEVFTSGKLVKSHGYHGELLSYLMVLPLVLLGFKWYVVKLFYLSFALLGLCVMYLLLRENTTRPIALLAAVLLVFHVGYLVGIRMGPKYVTPMHFFTLLPLLFFNRWLWSKGPRYFYATALFLGLGLCTRLWYLWFLNAFVIAGLSCFNRFWGVWGGYNQRTKALFLAISAGCFVAGSALLFYRDLSGGFKSVRVVIARAQKTPEERQGSETGYLMRMNMVLNNFNGMLSGENLSTELLGRKPFARVNRGFPLVFWSFYFLCVPFLFSAERVSLFMRQIWVLFTVMLLQMGMMRSYIPDLHVFILYPFPQMIIAGGMLSLFRTLRGLPWKSLVGVAVAVLVLMEARSAVLFMERFVRECRKGLRADIIYPMADDLMRMRSESKRIVFLEWASRVSAYYVHPELKDTMTMDIRTDYTRDFASVNLDDVLIVSWAGDKMIEQGGEVKYRIGGRLEEWVSHRNRELTVVKEYKTSQGETVYAAWAMPLRNATNRTR